MTRFYRIISMFLFIKIHHNVFSAPKAKNSYFGISIQVLQTVGLNAGEQQIFLPDQFVLIAFDVCMLYIVNFKISMLTN